MNNSRLPPVPKDVLAALELLPRAVIEDIDIKTLISGGLELLKDPTKPLTEKDFQKSFLSSGFERMRLIRLAVEELGLKAEVDALCGNRSDGTLR